MTTEDLLLRRTLVFVSGLVYWAGVGIQIRRVRRHIGRSPNVRPRGLKEKLLWVGWFFVVAVWLIQPFVGQNNATWLGLRLSPALLNLPTLLFGALLVLAGYVCTLWCYSAMGDTWRMGINRKEKNALVSRGPYRSVRHPIYLFQVVILTGVALLLPSLLSLTAILVHLACVWIKASDEESYLLSVHGQEYRDYLSGTGRLIPKLGRKV